MLCVLRYCVLSEYFDRYFWKNYYPRHNVNHLKGKKTKHSLEIFASLALLGPSTTREMAKFTLKKSMEYTHVILKGSNDASSLEKIYRKLIQGIPVQENKNQSKKYPGLVDHQFLVPTEKKINSKKNPVQTYFLSLKGCFFALAFQFTNEQLSMFIKNASQNHLYFAYLKKILDDTSIEFVKRIFILPVQSIIKNGMLYLGDSISFSYVLSEHQQAINDTVFQINDNQLISTKFRKSELENFKKILNHTFYTQNPTSDWQFFIKEYFYSDDNSLEFFDDYSDGHIEISLLYRLMKAVHFGYYSGFTENIPNKTQKIRHSKEWKEYKKYHSEFKSPQHRDKVKRIVKRY